MGSKQDKMKNYPASCNFAVYFSTKTQHNNAYSLLFVLVDVSHWKERANPIRDLAHIQAKSYHQNFIHLQRFSSGYRHKLFKNCLCAILQNRGKEGCRRVISKPGVFFLTLSHLLHEYIEFCK